MIIKTNDVKGSENSLRINDNEGSKKCLIVGPIVKRSELAEFKKFVEDEGSKAGPLESVEVKTLPDAFISGYLRDLCDGNVVALIATVQFAGSVLGPAKFISNWNGKRYKIFNVFFVARINERATIDDVIRKIGVPPADFAD